ncbi:hypothetical protein NM208_g14888 [Fusarium decemcellulare]|uniref:Uncharacterized protein n=1 Tax=Fusarium decemcellulare TaxID=57161 RepID=A0ACC1RFT1_9HYPO|nr:hypothetical protein NM208_g14888 [Fusarium decemcellulare]
MSSAHVAIRTVALAGASGLLGRRVLDALLDDGSFDVIVFARSGSKPDYPARAKIVTVDYESPESLEAALHGVDAVVSTLGKKTGLECQFKLIDAAVASGVKRFLPSEFGADLKSPKIRAFPTYRTKVQIEDYLETLAMETNLTYTYIYNSLLFDYGLALGVFGDFAARTVNLYDGGETPFSATTISTVARAVVATLHNFEQTKNRAVRVSDLSTTPRELLGTLQKLDSARQWVPISVDTGNLVREAEHELASGKFSLKAFGAFATRATFAPGFAASYNSDNELLSIVEMTQEELEEMLKTRMS